jgi:hypothetical protein
MQFRGDFRLDIGDGVAEEEILGGLAAELSGYGIDLNDANYKHSSWSYTSETPVTVQSLQRVVDAATERLGIRKVAVKEFNGQSDKESLNSVAINANAEGLAMEKSVSEMRQKLIDSASDHYSGDELEAYRDTIAELSDKDLVEEYKQTFPNEATADADGSDSWNAIVDKLAATLKGDAPLSGSSNSFEEFLTDFDFEGGEEVKETAANELGYFAVRLGDAKSVVEKATERLLREGEETVSAVVEDQTETRTASKTIKMLADSLRILAKNGIQLVEDVQFIDRLVEPIAEDQADLAHEIISNHMNLIDGNESGEVIATEIHALMRQAQHGPTHWLVDGDSILWFTTESDELAKELERQLKE